MSDLLEILACSLIISCNALSPILQLKDVEVLYPDKVYDGYGVEKDNPIHCVVDEAYPNKVLVASKFTASGLSLLLIQQHLHFVEEGTKLL